MGEARSWRVLWKNGEMTEREQCDRLLCSLERAIGSLKDLRAAMRRFNHTFEALSDVLDRVPPRQPYAAFDRFLAKVTKRAPVRGTKFLRKL